MKTLHIDQEKKAGALPTFSLTVCDEKVAVIYSDIDLQAELVNELREIPSIALFDYKEGLYERLTVQENIKFYHKWYCCEVPLPEVLVMFQLQHCAKQPLKKCTASELRRVYYAKHYMMNMEFYVFQEPIYGVDIFTINTFINALKRMGGAHKPVVILVSTMEHALLLGDEIYRLQNHGLFPIETEEQDVEANEKEPTVLSLDKLFKIPAKVEDKVILFDPMEIDYIESQDGKAMIVMNHETFTLDSTLSEIEKKLELYGFYRCHRSYIVNLQKVREIITWSKNTYSLRIDNKIQSTIPLSRAKIQAIQEIFNLK